MLEVLIVLAILTTFLFSLGLAVRPMQERLALQRSAKRLQSALRFLQSQALATGKVHEIRFDQGQNRYFLYAGNDLWAKVSLEEGIDYTNILDGGLPYLRFGDNGVPSSGMTIGLIGRRSRQIVYVVINPAVGRVRVSNHDDEE